MGVNLTIKEVQDFEEHQVALLDALSEPSILMQPNQSQFGVAVAVLQTMMHPTTPRHHVITDMPSGLGKSRITGALIYLLNAVKHIENFKVLYPHEALK